MMDLTTLLLNYGVLGLWTGYLIYEKKIMLNKIISTLDRLNDTIDREVGAHGK